MKNLKKPNYNQKQRIAKAGVDPMKVYVVEETTDSITVLDRESNKKLQIIGKHFTEL